jgi:hypothetical protein
MVVLPLLDVNLDFSHGIILFYKLVESYIENVILVVVFDFAAVFVVIAFCPPHADNSRFDFCCCDCDLNFLKSISSSAKFGASFIIES